jgi:3'-phosphoadenosine 5'-phosphosulfate sulfotransferase (PAPS reductase)/FAD synthetase
MERRGKALIPDLASYDHIIVYFSGGKDSLACLLHLLDSGADPARIELWHHEIDGREGSRLMDWPITPGYCKAVAQHFKLPIYFSWREGGFEREMLRHEALTAPVHFETPDGEVIRGGISGTPNTREKFPQVSANLSVRWCSASLKIDVAARAICNQDRFLGKRTLTISGERAEESPARAKYAEFEPDRTDRRNGRRRMRHVDRWRAVHDWSEAQVWAIIEKHLINPHPAYWLGWGRVSCMMCIFGNQNQWASARRLLEHGRQEWEALKADQPDQFARVAAYEAQFGTTIHRTRSVVESADLGTPYQLDPDKARQALAEEFTEQVLLAEWRMPPGAFGESAGPS